MDIILPVILIKERGDPPATCPNLELWTQEQGKSCRSQEGQVVLPRKEVGDFLGRPEGKTSCYQCRDVGSIPGWRAKIPQATQHGQKMELKKKNLSFQEKKNEST